MYGCYQTQSFVSSYGKSFVEMFLLKVITPFQSHISQSLYCLFQGVSYDHVELNFFLNGKSLECPVTGIRGTVYPVFYGEEWGCVVGKDVVSYAFYILCS